MIYAITQDNTGQIWAATLNDGLFRLAGGKWLQFGKRSGLQHETIHSLAADNSGHVFAASVKGVDEWYNIDNTFRHTNRRTVPDIDSFSSALNVMVRLPNGDIYLPYDKGLLLFKNKPAHYRIQGGLKITGAQLFFKDMEQLPTVLNYDQDHLTFDFRGVNFVHAERLHYRYKLAGFSNDWISTSDEFVTYPQLPPGKYNFIVQASLDENFENPAEDAHAFQILPPFWKTGWFWALGILTVASSIYMLVRWRIKVLQRVSKEKQERIMIEYEHLKSQVNPHFLFNSLNTLAALIEETPSAAVDYTEQLSEFYRDSLSESKDDLILIAAECEALERYAYIQHTRFGEALQIRNTLSGGLKAKGRVVPHALQLLVENAIKHNVVSRVAPLVIHIENDDSWLIVRNAINPKKQKERSIGLGLRNIRQRYKLVTTIEIETIIRNGEFIVMLPLL